MSALFELTAEIRQETGRGASRRLRRNESVPAILYGGGEAPQSLTLNHFHLKKALENQAFYSHILTLIIDGEKHKAVLKDLQRHPFKPRVLHLDFLRITGKEKITMQVPLHFKGDDVAPGVKEGNGVVAHIINVVEVRCLPANLPEYIEVDLSNLQLDESIHLSELKLPEGVELVALAHDNDQAVANIHTPREVEEEVPVEVPAAEVPTLVQKAPEEAAPAPTGKEEKKGGKDKG